MEVIGLVLATVGTTSRLTETVWGLCDAWRDAPASIHELRDFLTRTQDFWSAVRYGLESGNRINNQRSFGPTLGSETLNAPPEWEARSTASLIRLLQHGLEALNRLERILEQVADGADRPGNQTGDNFPIALNSRRRFQWVRRSNEVRKLRADLSRNSDLIYGQLLIMNVQISADVASSQEIVQRNIIESLELQLARAQEQLSSKFDASIQASMSQLLVEIERRGTLVTKAGDDSAPKGDEVVLKAYGSNNTRTANTAVDAYSPHRIISSCSWACGCNCHSLSSHTSWRLACFGQMFGSLAVSYHGFSNRQRRCTERSCRNNPTGGWLRLHYTFPRWLTDLSVLAAYRASQPRPEAVIRICRRVPMTDPNSVFDPIRKNDVEALKRLLSLEPFAAIDEEESGRPCISVALHFHRYDMVELLLRAGADPHRPDGLGHTAASDFFLEFNARPGSNSEAAFRCMPGMRAPLAEYIDNAGFLQVHKVVTGLIPVPLRDLIRSEKVSRQINHQVAENKWSPLFLAACRDDAENVSLLLDAGADPRLPTRYGSTPLHAASRQANLQMIEKLIHAGADPSQQDMSGCTAMSFVVDRWDPWTPRILTLMLEHGAGVNTVIIKSQNVQLLAQAAVRGHHKSVEWLVDHGADIEAQDSDGDTALLDCVVGSTCLSARVLLDHGANYKHVNKRGGTILHNLAIMGDAEAFRFWAGRSLEGLDSEKRDEMGRTPREWFEERRIMTEELREGFEGLIESVTSGSGGGERRGERKGERGDKGGGSYGEARGENDDAEFFDAVERQG